MSSDDTGIHDLATAFALDALDDDERASFEHHLVGCGSCRREVAEIRESLADVAESVATPPPATLRTNVLAEIGAIAQVAAPVDPALAAPVAPATSMPAGAVVDLAARRRFGTGMLSAAAVVMVLVGAVAFLAGRSSRSTDQFGARLAQLLSQPDSRVVDLGPASPAEAGRLRVAWSPSAHRAAVIGDELSQPVAGKAYELWLLGDAEPLAMGMLDQARDGHIRAVVDFTATPSKWGITLEPSAGSSVPTGEILFVGSA